MHEIIFTSSTPPLIPRTLWNAWNLELTLLIPLAITALVYLLGVWNVWRHAGVGHGISVRRCACFIGAILALFVALVSPLDALSGALFSAHMVQHMLLILVAAPLLASSSFPLALLWVLPRQGSRALGRRLVRLPILSQAWRGISSPVTAWLCFTLALWGWHTSALFDAALRDETIHAIEHLSFLWSAILFWWVLFERGGSSAARNSMTVPYLFTTSLQSGILGALMTFTSQPWYPYDAAMVAPWGLTPLQDQQLAGLIMWIFGGAVFTALTIVYFAAWFRTLEQSSKLLPHGSFPAHDDRE